MHYLLELLSQVMSRWKHQQKHLQCENLFFRITVFLVRAPDVIMTDNCSELREALYEVFPESTLLLCIFHILQQLWRWLFDKKHGVSANDRLEIMRSFRALVHSKEVD